MQRRTFVKAAAASGLTVAAPTATLAQTGSDTATPSSEGTDVNQTAPQTGYAPVNGLEMYYEIHGTGGTPLLLLHGGLFNIDLQFGPLLPGLSATRQVIGTDFQAHGRTNDIDDRPLTSANLTSDVVGLLQHLGVEQVDVFGYSVGGAVALELAIKHPELIRKAVISSVAFNPDGNRPENSGAVGEITVDMIAGTPMEQDYLAKSPHPEKLQQLLDKLGQSYDGFPAWPDADVEGYPAPTLITVGDCDAVKLDHAVRFLQLRGGDVNGDFVGVPASQLAVLPGTTHFFGLSRPSLVLELVNPFLDAPMPEDAPATPAVS
jgi:pimeloyl-ACP methyl ester carboxylesterase